MPLLEHKIAIITGATAGIGREIALQFAEHGADVIVFGTNSERAAQVMAALELKRHSSTQRFAAELGDISDKQWVDGVVEKLLKAFGKIDILVNNAGITRDALLMKMTEEEWDSVLAINLKSIFNFCGALVRPMLKARQGKIINISSVVGLMGNAGQTNYAASKAGMIGFSKALAKEVASRNICVNCIAPGFIQTSMTDLLSDMQKEALLKIIPMGRFGQTRHIADATLYLASSMADYVTGQVLVVDGGMAI